MEEEIIKEAVGDVVSLAMVKKHLKIESDFTEEDDLIAIYIQGAIDQVENFTERSLTLQTTIYTTKDFKDFVFERKSLTDVIEKIEYKETAESESLELPAVSYSVAKQGSEHYKVTYKDKPAAVNVKVYIKQGYAVGEIPKVIQNAMLLLVAEAYDRRDNNAAVINSKAKSLLQPYRKWRV